MLIAAALLANHVGTLHHLAMPAAAVVVAGVVAGFFIGVVAAIMGVAGGELLIPTIVLLFGTDIKIAGSLSLAVSLPTMIVAFARYSRDGSFKVLRQHTRLVITLAIGSIAGTILGGLLLGVVPEAVLVPGLAALLLLSSIKVWRHSTTE
ncbi:sulfite exporter TauE/SafE family protein [Micromonospora sp. SL4-19]|uniref:sulfite exporter TauE/SafE family protein n=1 Tax=Micromonospora sp. SL4-19 TaxID=3399129 RepID=UPI003A4D9C71